MAGRMDYDVITKMTHGYARATHHARNFFLYYSTSPGNPRIAGELHLRVASRDDLASFDSGSDLLLTNGHRWTRPLYALLNFHLPLYQKLREERIIPDD